MRGKIVQWFVVLVLVFTTGVSCGAVVEEVFELPVTVKSMYGQEVSQPIKVTVFRDDTREKAPYLVLNHGRPASPADFARMARQRYTDNSHYFVKLGFVVLVPTRVGYGESGGPDVEYSGRCEARHFAPAFAAAADQTVRLLEYAERLPFVDLSRGIVVGQSFGGATSVALAARRLPGLTAAINFAGGSGGSPSTRPEDPCGPDRLEALYGEYGAKSTVPTLWLYSENDRFWGAQWPRDWFAAFARAGGQGRFVPLPPYKNDGHSIFTGNRGAWYAPFEAFIRELGF